ncbi:hypothetical protein EGW08_007489 [Elysia chlorotica]|uniref:Saposin B-type domain-containing protein n=1 Tax=Elysia chlorotica TaxID=188477 RepID=A0A3S0ZR25_ELYCH|nr:hypothetical protein EGW08_007489 [Elysia chlorotica]
MSVSVLVSVLLVASAPLTEGFLSRFARPSDSCARTASECLETHLDKFQPIRDLSDVQRIWADPTLLSEMATSLEQTGDCLDNVVTIPKCAHMAHWPVIVRFFADFIKYPGITDKFAAASSSQCLTDDKVFKQLGFALEKCLDIFTQALKGQPGDVCGSFSQLWQCVEQEGSHVCGAAYSDLFHSFKQFLFSPSRVPGYLAWLSSILEKDFTVCEQQLVPASFTSA